MSKRTKELVRAARALIEKAHTDTGNDEPTWLVPSEQILDLWLNGKGTCRLRRRKTPDAEKVQKLRDVLCPSANDDSAVLRKVQDILS